MKGTELSQQNLGREGRGKKGVKQSLETILFGSIRSEYKNEINNIIKILSGNSGK